MNLLTALNILKAALLCLLLSPALHAAETTPTLAPIPPIYNATQGVSLYREGWERRHNTLYARCRLINRTDQVIRYTGYDPASPIFQIETRGDKGWSALGHLFCGTGISTYELPPKRSLMLDIAVGTDDARIRIGIPIAILSGKKQKDEVVWTQPTRIPKDPHAPF